MTNAVERIASMADIHVIPRSENAALLKLDDASRFLDACEKLNVIILGIEGFQVNGDQMVSYVDVIADFSSITHNDHKERSRKSISLSREFLQKFTDSQNILLEFELA